MKLYNLASAGFFIAKNPGGKMALSLLAANNAQTVLAAGISSTATSLTVNAGTGTLFPSPVAGTSFFKLTIIDAATGSLTEIVHVTARNGDVFTIQRGQEGTVPRSWSANDIVANMMTAGTLSYILGSFQPLDPTLTALAALVGVANKLPYFNGGDTAALTDLTQVGRDIIGKTDIAAVLQYLGLGDVNSGRLLNVQVFTSSGLYTPTPGTKKAIVEVQGAGGAGAGTNSPATMCAASGSGTSGAYAKAIIDNPTPQQVTVGSGGKGGVDNPAGNGNAGGQSSFGSLVTAIGGLGGEAMTAGTGVWSAFFSGTMPAVQFTGANIFGRGCGMPTISLRLGGVFSYSGNGGDSIFGAGGIGSRGQSRGGDGV
ncbi:hypothetical protein MGZ19_003593, partial [Escherichia coli]|nr:hypothetical protein [Escherichia coli]